MDLFGSAPNLKCSNEAVCYNATASPQTPSNNREGFRLGFDYIVTSILLWDKLLLNCQSSSVWTQNATAHKLTGGVRFVVFEQSFFLVIVIAVNSFCA